MKRLALLLGLLAPAGVGLVLAGLVWIDPASAHGCHHAWQQNPGQGWHSHGARCDTRKGLGVSQRSRARSRRV